MTASMKSTITALALLLAAGTGMRAEAAASNKRTVDTTRITVHSAEVIHTVPSSGSGTTSSEEYIVPVERTTLNPVIETAPVTASATVTTTVPSTTTTITTPVTTTTTTRTTTVVTTPGAVAPLPGTVVVGNTELIQVVPSRTRRTTSPEEYIVPVSRTTLNPVIELRAR